MINKQQVIGTKLSDIPHHSYVQFTADNGSIVFFNSKFDSGNLKMVTKNGYDHYSIWTASDAEGTSFESYPKSWFYFETGGFKKKKVSFSVHRVHFLWAMVNKKQLYRPVYRINQFVEDGIVRSTNWERLPYPVLSLSVNNDEQLVVKFDFYFPENIKSVQFAFTYPYSHRECREQIIQIYSKFQNDCEILVRQYQLCKSYQGRTVDLLMISSHQGKDGVQNVKTDQTFTLGGVKMTKFRNNKPIIFISARVHPIQTPSSYTMKGIIKFLLSKTDYRAHLLRKYFVFVLVPMLNPDGVSNGYCRMDSLNQNLNRYYKNPDPSKQPTCYSVMKLGQHYNKDKRLFMYLDLHAHPAYKGNFIFGNAIFDYIDQVQSNLFPKVISQNCINFQFEQCIFSRKHMTAKDKNQQMNKQGCGRVIFYKQFGLTHSYTLQCGYHCNAYNNNLEKQTNKNKSYIVRSKLNQKGEKLYDNFEQETVQQNQQALDQYVKNLNEKKGTKNYTYSVYTNTSDQIDDIQSAYYKNEQVLFRQETFQNLGRNVCISILDVWNRNPYTRVSNLNQLRKQIAEKHAKLDRFRKQQAGIKTKQKQIVQLIQTQIYGQWHKRNVFQSQGNNQSKKSVSQLRKTDRGRMLDLRAQVCLSSNSRLPKGTVKVKTNSIIKEQKKIGVINPHIQSIKTLSVFEQHLNLSSKVVVALQKNNFKSFMNVRIRNIQLGNRVGL